MLSKTCPEEVDLCRAITCMRSKHKSSVEANEKKVQSQRVCLDAKSSKFHVNK